MAEDGKTTDKLPPQSAEIIREMARLHGSTQQKLPAPQRLIETITAFVVRPASILVFLITCLVWIGGNLLCLALSGSAPDAPPFPLLELAATVGSMLLVLLVLATQRREDDLAELREQLNLQIALLNERKASKLIEMLTATSANGAFRDADAESLAKPADLHTIVSALRASHD